MPLEPTLIGKLLSRLGPIITNGRSGPRAIYGDAFDPQATLNALPYFGGGMLCQSTRTTQ